MLIQFAVLIIKKTIIINFHVNLQAAGFFLIKSHLRFGRGGGCAINRQIVIFVAAAKEKEKIPYCHSPNVNKNYCAMTAFPLINVMRLKHNSFLLR